MFRSLALRSYEGLEEVDPIYKVTYKIANPKMIPMWTDLKPGHDYSMLDESGIIKIGSQITDTTVLVGRYLENPETHQIKDSSVLPTVFTKGRVESVVLLNQANGMRLVKVRILQERIPELGDKFGSRHGQKGTMGMIIPAENMPHTREGIIPDVIVNPHGLTSRMTVAQVIEVLFGRLGAEVAAKCNGTAFCNRENIVKTVGETLETLGLHPHTENIMYCGTTGKQLQCSIFMGPLYFMRMKHLTSDKINSRAEGRREIRTHQPTGGRGNEGGMRIGEMERDAVLAHGVSLFLQESMMKRADGASFWVCNGCGSIPIANEKEKLFVCPTCDGPVEFSGSSAETLALIEPLKRSRVTFSRVEMPYALKLLDQEITTFMSAGLRFVTSKTVGRLKDNFIKWSTEGGFSPEAPKAYQELLKEIIPLPATQLVTVDSLPGPSNEIIHGKALAGGNYPIEDAAFEIPKIGGSTNVIGHNDGAIEKLINLQQTGGNRTVDAAEKLVELSALSADAIRLAKAIQAEPPVVCKEQKGGSGQELEETIQIGGVAPVESIGHDAIPVKHDLEEEWIPDFMPPSILKQSGGMAPLQMEPDNKVEILGTDINPSNFNQPPLDSPPFVIANPYVSPPLSASELAPGQPPVGAIPVDATIEQPVVNGPEIINAIKVFENSDIRVIKLA